MLEFIKNDKNRTIIIDSIITIIGLLFCILPETAMAAFETIISIILVLIGVSYVVLYYFSSVSSKEYLFLGIAYLILGLFTGLITSLLAICLGVILILQGLKLVLYSSELKVTVNKNWWFEFLFGICLCVFGIVIIIVCNSSLATKTISIVIGIFLIYYSVSDLILVFGLKREYNIVKKNLSMKFKTINGEITNNETKSEKDNSQSSDNNQSNKTDCDDFKDYNIN